MNASMNNMGKMNPSEIPEKQSKQPTNDKEKLRKKMIKMMVIITIGVVALLVILLLCSLLLNQDHSYRDIENILKDAAISYFDQNKESLPSTESQLVEIESSILIQNGNMKDLSEYTKEGVVCTGKVVVQKSGDEYLYTPYLDCGENYSTQELYQVITDASNIVQTGYGLYAYNNSYVYRGETVNNYVELENGLWRIVKVTSDNNVVLIKEEPIGMSYPWDDRYNSNVGYNLGINNYSNSRIKEYLESYYDGDEEEKILSADDKSKIVSYNVCTGKRTEADSTNDNSIECQSAENTQKLGLLTVSDYINASMDSNCTTATSRACQNYNYLAIDTSWWLGTAVNEETNSEVFMVNSNGTVESTSASNYAYIRPVVYLNSRVLYASGKGTEENPYKIR